MLRREDGGTAEACISVQPQAMLLADVSDCVEVVECAKHLNLIAQLKQTLFNHRQDFNYR